MRRRPVVLLLAAILLGAAACSSSGGGALELISRSVDAAADAGTYAFEMTAELEAAGEGSFAMRMTGDADDTVPAAAMTMEMSGGGQDLSFEMILIETVAYMNFAELGEQLGAPVGWVSFDLASIPGFDELLGQNAFGSSDPTASLDVLRGAGDVEELGTESVRGTPTTHYRAVVNLQDALDEASVEEREGLQQFLDSLPAEFDVEDLRVPVEVWIDDEGLPRRFTMTFDFDEFVQDPSIPAGATMTMAMELFDFGKDVNIEPPPAGEVTDFTEVLGGQLGDSG